MKEEKKNARVCELLTTHQVSTIKQAEKLLETEERQLLKLERESKRLQEIADAARIWGVYDMTVDKAGRIETVPRNYYHLISKHLNFKVIRLDDFSG